MGESLVAASAPSAASSSCTITEYQVPTPGAGLGDITAGPDGNVWFTESSQIGRITPDGVITEFPFGEINRGITAGPDGNLWFTQFFGKIGRLSPGGQYTEFSPDVGTGLASITTGADGNLWFVKNNAPVTVVKMTPEGATTVYPLGADDDETRIPDITRGPDDNIWFSLVVPQDVGGGYLGRITPTGPPSLFQLPSDVTPASVTAGADGGLWFTDTEANKVGRFDPVTLAVTLFPVPTTDSAPRGITAGPDGNVWFAEEFGEQIGRITPEGFITECPVPTAPSNPFAITAGPDGNIWFTEPAPGIHQIGKLELPASSPRLPPVTPPDCVECDIDGPIDEAPGSSGGNPAANGFSEGNVRYFDGTARLDSTDLASDGFGTPWGHARSWSNGPYAPLGFNGSGMVLPYLPHLLRDEDSGQIAVVTSGTDARHFNLVGGTYSPTLFLPDQLRHDPDNREFVLTDSTGALTTFHDFSPELTSAQQGQFKRHTDPAGYGSLDPDNHVLRVISHAPDGKPAEVQRRDGTGGTTVVESYLYEYLDSGPNAGLLQSVTLRRQEDGGTWKVVRKVDYTYYGTSEMHGNLGDLKTAVIMDEDERALDTEYYRWYKPGEPNGYAHGLKYVFRAQSYARLTAAVANPFTASDGDVASYADAHFKYDAQQRVVEQVVQGQGCSSCSGGLGRYTFAYGTSTFGDGFNIWKYKTVETLPDLNQNIVYSNAFGEVMLKVFRERTTGREWATFYRYDGQGRILQMAYPSAVTGSTTGNLSYDVYADLLHWRGSEFEYLKDAAGLVENYAYYGSGTTAPGYFQESSLQRGESDEVLPQFTVTYEARTVPGVTVLVPSTEKVYRGAGGAGQQVTTYGYGWYEGTTQMASMTVTHPVIDAGQNGPGTPDIETSAYDEHGRMTSGIDGDGFLTSYAYDKATGAVTRAVVDAGGLNLTTHYEIDSLGRTTLFTDPNGNLTYIVYDDFTHELRTYAGWDDISNRPIGPTVVMREHRPAAGSGQAIYYETLTMSADPALTTGPQGEFRPAGTEAISNLHTLARTFTNRAGQLVELDRYFNLSGLNYSATTPILLTSGGTPAQENVHFYRSEYGYDDRGRLNRTLSPTDTVYRTVYDGLDRMVGSWVGTSDTPDWTPGGPGNLVQVSAYVYDGTGDTGGVGDSNLTRMIEFPNGGADPTGRRVTDHFYDWRDRLVASKGGVQDDEGPDTQRPIVYHEYDNLDQVTATEQYDGDGLFIIDADGNGVPDKPTPDRLRARVVMSYDDQGRVFRTRTHSVDQVNGAVSVHNALTSDYWYDRRGNLIKAEVPGGLVTKVQFDGAGRPVTTFLTDDGEESSWSDAGNVLGDIVLTQVETGYDANGNVLLTTTRERFHNARVPEPDESGRLGTPDSETMDDPRPKARVSYQAGFYDDLDRMTANVNVGTNGGDPYGWPGSVPERSDTVLVSEYGYNAAGWLGLVTDPRRIVTHNSYDNLGRVTRTVEAFTGGSPSGSSDRTTEFTYDGSDHLLTLKALLPGGEFQATGYLYGVSPATGSVITSNDLLREVRLPDESTGSPSLLLSDRESYAYNALGELVSRTDRNQTIHAHSYDVLGRLLSDAVTIPAGSVVDGLVRSMEVAYDTAGRPFRFTSRDADGGVLNQVERTYNGLSQLVAEAQSHAGPVTAGTPQVQYGYSFSDAAGAPNHSRMTSITYPSGRELTYEYGADLDDRISRLSALKDGSLTLEAYTYLGLNTVVERAYAEPGIELSYLSPDGAPGGASNDPYTGLDRFGRVVDLRWARSDDPAQATDHFQYGYDRDSNRLYRQNVLDAAFGELYHASGATADSARYDHFNQMTGFARGELSDSDGDGLLDTVSGASATRGWQLDEWGNWRQLTGSSPQVRVHNRQNQIMDISGVFDPEYDGNGNVVQDTERRHLIYDAWDRLVHVTDNDGAALAEYAYDALGRRVQEDKAGPAVDLYFSVAWQVLEEQVGGEARAQYVWSPVYVDALVLRDRDVNEMANDGLEERLYVQQDANYNVTALVDRAGGVVERYAYDPYGAVLVLTPEWQVAGSGSQYGWVYLHQGGRYEAVSALYHFRHRDHSPALGRWMQRDPLGYAAGDLNLYRYLSNGPADGLDPLGLQGILDLVPARHYTGPSAIDQTERMLANRARVVATGGTVTPLMAGSAKVYGSDGNQNFAGAMVEAGHHIVHMSVQAAPGILSITPAAPVVAAVTVAVPLVQGDLEGAVTAAATMVLVGGVLRIAGAGCAGTGARAGAPKKPIHGNSPKNPNPHHVYVIVDTHTGKLVKPGISGKPLIRGGESQRANEQLRVLNRVYEHKPGHLPRYRTTDRYKATVVERNVSQARAKWIEQMIIDKHAARNAGASPSIWHDKPKPRVETHAEFHNLYGFPHNTPQGGRY